MEPTAFTLPPPIDDAWSRIANQGGSPADLKLVLDFIAKSGAFDPADLRAFDVWLTAKGLRRKDLPIAILNAHKATFDRAQEALVAQTRGLLERIASGPHLTDFLATIGAFTTPFKRFAYLILGAVSGTHNIVFVCSSLSQESPDFAQALAKIFPESPVVQLFAAYLKGSRLPVGLVQGWIADRGTYDGVTPRLFQLAALRPADLSEQLAQVPHADVQKFVYVAERLFRVLPDKNFGKFVRLNLAVFLCVANPVGELVDAACRILVATGEPNVAELIGRLGTQRLAAELRDPANRKVDRGRFLAAIIDACRKQSPHFLIEIEEELKALSSSKVPVVAVAASAALLQNSPQDSPKFESLLRSRLQVPKDQSIPDWLLKNPDFIRYLRVDKASLKGLQTILAASKSNSTEITLQVCRQVLAETFRPESNRRREEALRALAAIGGGEADSIFSDFALHLMEDEGSNQFLDLMTQGFSRTLLRRNFGALVERSSGERGWAAVFAALRVGATESDIASSVEALFRRNSAASEWLLQHLLPGLIEQGLFRTGFSRFISDQGLLIALAKRLSSIAFEDIKYLRSFPAEYGARVTAVKGRVLPVVRGGLRVAMRNAGPGDEINAQLSKLSSALSSWAESDSPRLDTSLKAYATTDIPSAVAPSKMIVESFFRSQVNNLSTFTLFSGINPWAIDLAFDETISGSWPKPELLFDQIARTFIFFTQLKRRAVGELESLGETTKIELAKVLRETLADVESHLAGYFIFRTMLQEIGINPVMSHLGERVEQSNLSSKKHKILRDGSEPGLKRVFSLGLIVGDVVVGSAIVKNSGTKMIAIDFGTTNSSVAVFSDADTEPRLQKLEIDPESYDPNTIPSALCECASRECAQDSSIYGHEALRHHIELQHDTKLFHEMKLFFDKSTQDAPTLVQTKLGVTLREEHGFLTPVPKTYTYRVFDSEVSLTPSEFVPGTGQLIRELIRRSNATAQDRAEIVLGVPHNFTGSGPLRLHEAARRGTSGESSGNTRIHLYPEPIAAARSYAQIERGNILVLDYGGGTLDITVMPITASKKFDCSKFGIGGFPEAGSRMDQAIVHHCLSKNVEIAEWHASQPIRIKQRFKRNVERAKIALSVRDEAFVDLPGSNFEPIRLGTSDLFLALQPIMSRMVARVTETVVRAVGAIENIDFVVLSGGTSLNRVVQASIESIFQHLSRQNFVMPDPAKPEDVETCLCAVVRGLAWLRRDGFEPMVLPSSRLT